MVFSTYLKKGKSSSGAGSPAHSASTLFISVSQNLAFSWPKQDSIALSFIQFFMAWYSLSPPKATAAKAKIGMIATKDLIWERTCKMFWKGSFRTGRDGFYLVQLDVLRWLLILEWSSWCQFGLFILLHGLKPRFLEMPMLSRLKSRSECTVRDIISY